MTVKAKPKPKTKPKAKRKAPKAKKKAPIKKKAPVKAKKPLGVSKADGLISVSDIARSLGLHPKVARAKLRRNKMSSVDGRWARMKPDSKEHKAIIVLLKKDVRPRVKAGDGDED